MYHTLFIKSVLWYFFCFFFNFGCSHLVVVAVIEQQLEASCKPFMPFVKVCFADGQLRGTLSYCLLSGKNLVYQPHRASLFLVVSAGRGIHSYWWLGIWLNKTLSSFFILGIFKGTISLDHLLQLLAGIAEKVGLVPHTVSVLFNRLNNLNK